MKCIIKPLTALMSKKCSIFAPKVFIMEIEEYKRVNKEYKALNRQARAIIKQMQLSPDSNTMAELQRQWDELQQRLDEVNEVAERILEENETPLTDIVTPTQAQNIWNNIRSKIRLAKFNDDGVELPAIDMKRLFDGRKYMSLKSFDEQIKHIIEEWNPD